MNLFAKSGKVQAIEQMSFLPDLFVTYTISEYGYPQRQFELLIERDMVFTLICNFQNYKHWVNGFLDTFASI